MNKARRKAIGAIGEKLGEMQFAIEQLAQELSEIAEEESAAFDNLPEAIQGSARGEAMVENIALLEGVMDELDAIDLLEMIRELEEVGT